MAKIMGERKVIFSGLWRSSPRRDVDRQLRMISEDYQKKPGLPASFQITPSAVELYIITENGLTAKNKRIELRDIYDVIVNKYHPLCLMVVYSDTKNTHNFLVCQCYSDMHGIHLSKIYRECKFKYNDSTRGDGSRQNWVLKPKLISNNNEGESESITSTEQAESSNGDENRVANISETNNELSETNLDSPGYHSIVFNEAHSQVFGEGSVDSQVIASLPPGNGHIDFDDDSLVSMESYTSMKEELFSLSQEVRSIKVLLQQQGINLDTLQHDGQFNGNYADGEKQSPSSSPKSGASDRRVNFAVDDSKVIGDSRKGIYVKHLGSATRNRVPIRPYVYRLNSSGNITSSSVPGNFASGDVVDSSHKISNYQQPVATRITGPPPRRGSQNAVSTTIQKPIEQVYMMQPRRPHSSRPQIVIHAGKSATLPAARRTIEQEKPLTTILKNGHH